MVKELYEGNNMLKKLFTILTILLSSTLYSQEFNLHGSFESGILMNHARYNGGNEFSIGDYFARLNLSMNFIRNISVDVQYIPEHLVVNTNDPNKINFHNENWLRADGYTNEPFFMAKVILPEV